MILLNKNNANLNNAIKLIYKHKKINKINMKKLKSMNFSIDKLKEIDDTYNFIIKNLKKMKKSK